MKRRMILTSTIAAMGAGLIAATALAQQPPAPPPTTKTRPQFSAEDHAAFIDAHLAAIRAGLKLTADQDKLWPPVEQAARDMAKQAQEARSARSAQTQPGDPLDRMTRAAEDMSRRAASMTKLATAARPLYASLSDDQKKRLRVLMHPPGMGRGEHNMIMGEGHGDHSSMSRHRDQHNGGPDRR